MCGIAGIVAPKAQQYEKHLERRLKSLRHRGPDAFGTYVFANCVLGHTRLSIIDLQSGSQPMISHDWSAGITFNGEIYGYQDLQKELASYPFRTTSDTEVILALYARYGPSMMARLPGMFAFGIWDDKNQKLFCARDRFGEKPLYYSIGMGGEFIFASEIKAILSTGLVSAVLNRNSLTHYLKKLYVHPYYTIYENIQVLPPAHQALYRNGTIEVVRYWQLPEPHRDISLSDAMEKFQTLFSRAVEQQLVADVPVAAFLSRGLYSSSVITVASRKVDRLRTFSFGFDGNRSELPYARAVAKQYGTDHIELEDQGCDVGELLVRMQEVYDEPFADSSNIPTYLICGLARQHGKVVITGDGGDELLAGYTYWYQNLHYMYLEQDDSAFHRAFVKAMLWLTSKTRLSIRNNWACRYQAIKNWKCHGSIISAHEAQNCYFSDEQLAALLGSKPAHDPLVPRNWQLSDTIDDALRMDLEDYMPGEILTKIDRASMAHGLELRAPFLDVDFASFCISLPPRLKISTRADKIILRETFSGQWPESIRIRKKQGFGAPVNQWLQRAKVRALKEDFLNDPTKKIFNLISFEGAAHLYPKITTKLGFYWS